MDDDSLSLLEKCSGRKILAIGTMGGDAKGDYGTRVSRDVRNAIETNNVCDGVYLCQGAVNLKSVRKRMKLPKDNPHHVSLEKYQRMLLTQGHPDKEDLKDAGQYVLEHIRESEAVEINGSKENTKNRISGKG